MKSYKLFPINIYKLTSIQITMLNVRSKFLLVTGAIKDLCTRKKNNERKFLNETLQQLSHSPEH